MIRDLGRLKGKVLSLPAPLAAYDVDEEEEEEEDDDVNHSLLDPDWSEPRMDLTTSSNLSNTDSGSDTDSSSSSSCDTDSSSSSSCDTDSSSSSSCDTDSSSSSSCDTDSSSSSSCDTDSSSSSSCDTDSSSSSSCDTDSSSSSDATSSSPSLPSVAVSSAERRRVHRRKIEQKRWRLGGRRKVLRTLKDVVPQVIPKATLTTHAPKRTYFCTKCYTSFTTLVALALHEELCWNDRCQEEIFPDPHEKRMFTDVQKTIPLPIVGALDFECAVKPIQEEGRGPHSNKSTSQMTLENYFHPVSFGLAFINDKGKLLKKVYVSSDTDCLSLLFKALDSAERDLGPLLQRYPHHNVPREEVMRLKKEAKVCYLCKKPFPYPLHVDGALQRRNFKMGGVNEYGVRHADGRREEEEEDECLDDGGGGGGGAMAPRRKWGARRWVNSRKDLAKRVFWTIVIVAAGS